MVIHTIPTGDFHIKRYCQMAGPGHRQLANLSSSTKSTFDCYCDRSVNPTEVICVLLSQGYMLCHLHHAELCFANWSVIHNPPIAPTQPLFEKHSCKPQNKESMGQQTQTTA